MSWNWKPNSRSVLAALGTLALLASTAACGSSSAGGDGKGCTGQTVKVGITKSVSDAPLYVAKASGYFEAQGLSVEFLPFDSAAKMIAPLGSGQLDVGAGAPSAGFYNAVARGVNLRIVADKGSMPENYGYMPLLVRDDLVKSGKVDGIADLKGMKVAEPAQATATSATASVMLGSAGLGYNDIKHEFIGFSSHIAAFQNSAIDASLTTEPSATVAVQRGVAVKLAAPPEYYNNQQLAVILYSGTFADEQSSLGTCFMSAYLKGARDYLAAFPDGKFAEGKQAQQVVDAVSNATGIDPNLYRKITPNYVHPNGKVNVDSLKRDYHFFQQQDFVKGEVSVPELVDRSFAQTAVKKIGKYQPPESN